MKFNRSFNLYFFISLLIVCSCSSGVKDKDGNSYKTVKIGNQTWMSENLTVTHFRNGDPITEATTSTEWELAGKEGKPAWCISQNDTENGKKYGKLYNWFAVNDPRGLSPKGWHIATDDEWTKLTDFLGGQVIAAFKMRAPGISQTGVKSEDSGFSGLPGGACNRNGNFYGLGSHGLWWTATEFNASDSWIRVLNYIVCDINSMPFKKPVGLSVRCVKD
jgi:uncharacterized protein (TIGR02145 family)